MVLAKYSFLIYSNLIHMSYFKEFFNFMIENYSLLEIKYYLQFLNLNFYLCFLLTKESLS